MTAAIADVFHTLITQPTTLCNLDCAYCYLPDRKRSRAPAKSCGRLAPHDCVERSCGSSGVMA